MEENLQEIVSKLCKHGPQNVALASGRRVRAYLNGLLAVDTTSAQHVWEHPYYPQFYVPFKEIRHQLIVDRDLISGHRDEESGNFAAEIWKHPKVPKEGEKSCTYVHFLRGRLEGLIRLTFKDMDLWFEEDERIYVHPRDPTKRIAVLPSSRSLEISLDGVTLAKPTSAIHLIEPMLPVRYYVPAASVDPSILIPSELKSRCPYKGEAEYYHVRVNGKMYENLIWYYRYPTLECASVAGALCFFNERVDIKLDERLVERPKSRWSN